MKSKYLYFIGKAITFEIVTLIKQNCTFVRQILLGVALYKQSEQRTSCRYKLSSLKCQVSLRVYINNNNARPVLHFPLREIFRSQKLVGLGEISDVHKHLLTHTGNTQHSYTYPFTYTLT